VFPDEYIKFVAKTAVNRRKNTAARKTRFKLFCKIVKKLKL